MSTTQPSGDYRVTGQVGYLLRHTAIFQSVVPANQLSAAQFVVLCAVRDHAGATIAGLVEATAMDEPAVRGIVERLKWTDLVCMAHEPGDKRHPALTLPLLGQTTVSETLPHVQQISELTLGDLNPDDRQQLTRLPRPISGTA